MVDQSSLKEASTLFFQDQSDSLRLNERMKTIKSEQKQQQHEIQGGVTTNLVANSATAPNVDNTEVARGAMGPIEITAYKMSLGTSKRNNNDMSRDAERNNEISLSSPVVKRARLSPSEALNDKNHNDNRETNFRGESTASALETANQNNVSSLSKLSFLAEEQPVQKFKYVEDKEENRIQDVRRRKGKEASKNNINNNYRILVATFSSVYEAACGDHNQAKAIHEACEEGGNFLSRCNGHDSYYYQYEVLPTSLTMDADAASKLAMIRTSMGFHSFLHGTALPPWYPLSNLFSQGKVLNLLSMKQGDSRKAKRDGSGTTSNKNTSSDVAAIAGGTRLPIHPRTKKQYQIGVIGGGIAGLACCQELVTALNNDGIDAKVTLVEARSRLGGRIATDRSWKTEKNNVFPVELGASWIHGIDDNPLATLAQDAGIEFVRTSEEVKMVDTNLKEVDSKMDEKMGKLFDDLLDHATEDCWTDITNEESAASYPKNGQDPQTAVRWYASCFSKDDATKNKLPRGEFAGSPASIAVSTPAHRQSNDRSVDIAIGKVIAKHKFREFSKLSTEEHRMLLWNSKNVEYALGSNLDNLSMKYWDVDDRHAFEGDHVLLKEGYSTVIDHILQSLKAAGSNKFEYILNFPVGRVEYGRKSEREAYGRDRFGRERHLAELSDSCSISSEDGSETKFFDFLVSAVPLGVLKESVHRAKDVEFQKKMTFVPSLPFCKIDAISNVGFGLLNKVYIQFSEPFWRIPGFYKDKDDCLFGNVTGVNPHHYMFFDIGKRLGSEDDSPAILMSLVSGKEAVALEYLSDADVLKELVETLKAMFPEAITIPDPIGFRITRWGKDRFSRGSYTYLPPGSTDQDFQMLQSPVNASGDSLLLESRAEVMRLFFAGEHTTALHPSVTHGAMLSGLRAAQEVVSTIQSKNKDDKDMDRVIPISVFKYWNPTTILECNLCHKIGRGTTREGPLLAFRRGARQVLVHNNCAEFCPEVEVVDFKWKNVIRAVKRGKAFTCCFCSQNGATIGCSASNCHRMFHFSCAEGKQNRFIFSIYRIGRCSNSGTPSSFLSITCINLQLLLFLDTGWRFDRDGKAFYCDECRPMPSPSATKRCDRVSMKYYMMKNEGEPLACHLCRMPKNEIHGELLAFQQGVGQMCLVHLNCMKYTTIIKTFEEQHSRMIHEYQNVFDVLKHSKICSLCNNSGASISCANGRCDQVFHYHCAISKFGWDFQRKGSKRFQCGDSKSCHIKDSAIVRKDAANEENESSSGGLTFQHNLFAQFRGTNKNNPKVDIPGNLDMSGDGIHSPQNHRTSSERIESPNNAYNADSDGSESLDDDDGDGDDDDDSFVLEEDGGQGLEVMDLPLSSDVSGPIQLVHLERSSREDFWNISFQVMKIHNAMVVTVVDVAPVDTNGKEEETHNTNFENMASLQAKDIIVAINGSKIGSDGLSTLRCILFRLKQEVDLILEVIRR
jgi:lysine-specific histone demethylase 1